LISSIDRYKKVIYDTLSVRYGSISTDRTPGKAGEYIKDFVIILWRNWKNKLRAARRTRWNKILSTVNKINNSDHAVGRLEVADEKCPVSEENITKYIKLLNTQIKRRIRILQRKSVAKKVEEIQDWCLKKPYKFWAYIRGQRSARALPAIKHTDTFEPLSNNGDEIESACFTNNIPNLERALKNQYGPAVEIVETSLNPSDSLPRVDVQIDFSVENITNLLRKVTLGPLHARK